MSQSRTYSWKNGFSSQSQESENPHEKTRLQQQQPVKLQPSWEENNLPDDELNFKHLNMADASLTLNAPPDKYNLVYIAFLIHGIGILTPWNMFITAIDYFVSFKLAESYIGFVFPHIPNFMQYLTFCSQIPAVILNWMNIFVRMGGNFTVRIVWSIGIIVVMFILTVILAMIDTSSTPYFFFYITMISVVILNSANGVYQNTVYGMSAKLPGKYTGAIILGNNISGTFTACIKVFSKMGARNIKMAAIYYFITALFVLLICFDTYFALPLNKYYRHYDLKEKKEKQVARESGNERPPYWEIFKQTLPQIANVFITFLVTLACFPAIQSGIEKSDSNFFVSDEYYVDVMCFLTFNIFAMIGSTLPSYFIWPGPKTVWIPCVLRLAYIPLFLLCNYQAKGVTRVLPVLINNDYVYFILASTMALTSGYLSSIVMMYAPGMVEERHASTAGMMAGASLITGIFAGILLSFLWPWLIGHVGN